MEFLKPGDRVRVPGHGIVVVEEIDWDCETLLFSRPGSDTFWLSDIESVEGIDWDADFSRIVEPVETPPEANVVDLTKALFSCVAGIWLVTVNYTVDKVAETAKRVFARAH